MKSLFAVATFLFVMPVTSMVAWASERPNILVAIADDQSYPHCSAYGYQAISTPAFDRVAKSGVLFNNAFTPAPGCSPMRAAFLTGRQIWQIEHAGTHASSFPIKYDSYQKRLEDAGYFVGYTGKPWAPGNFKESGRTRNPAGPEFGKQKLDPPEGISKTDYAANFGDFLKARPKDQPFSFWYGATEPHRSFGKGLGAEHGLDADKVVVPPFLPDTPEIRSDILDYCFEIQWFDRHLGEMLDALEAAGELENTLVVVTSDNGMAFPRAKANCFEYGIHMPLAVAWPAKFPAGRSVDDVVSLIDVTATIYDVTNVPPPSATPLAGRSLRNVLASNENGMVDPQRDATYSGRERHSSSRYNTLGYPQRVIRTTDYLYIRNFKPERWPAGAPRKLGAGKYPTDSEVQQSVLGPMHGGYADIDPCPSLDFLVANAKDPQLGKYLAWAVDRRAGEELYNIKNDPGCLHNLADDDAHRKVKDELAKRLTDYLIKTEDPRVVASDGGDIFETYPRYSRLRWFPVPDWAKANPDSVPKMDWLEERRPAK
tara:strand:+ start:372739 stop:374361 length:1623 start_codon:yes stop_codon:yes gene_type:complete